MSRSDQPLPARHQPSLLLLDYTGTPIRESSDHLEFPFFGLSTRPQKTVRTYKDHRGNFIELHPSPMYGLPTIYDQDVLIFAATCLTASKKAGKPISRRVHFETIDVLETTNRVSRGHQGGQQYTLIENALRRLSTTSVRTNISRDDHEIERLFGVLDDATLIRRRHVNGKSNSFALIGGDFILSKWLFNAIDEGRVWPMHADYFRLRSPLDRALYQVACKFFAATTKETAPGKVWEISFDKLYNYTGSISKRPRDFHHKLCLTVDRHRIWADRYAANTMIWESGERIDSAGQPLKARPMLFPDYDLSIHEARGGSKKLRFTRRLPETVSMSFEELSYLTPGMIDDAQLILGPEKNAMAAFADWKAWCRETNKPPPRHPVEAFYGWCRKLAAFSPGVFPSGSIVWANDTRWEKIARQNCPDRDPDWLAKEWRGFCARNGIPLDDPDLDIRFRGFCMKIAKS